MSDDEPATQQPQHVLPTQDAPDTSRTPVVDYHAPPRPMGAPPAGRQASMVVLAGLCLAFAVVGFVIAVLMLLASLRVEGVVCTLAWPAVFFIIVSGLALRLGVRLLNKSKL